MSKVLSWLHLFLYTENQCLMKIYLFSCGVSGVNNDLHIRISSDCF